MIPNPKDFLKSTRQGGGYWAQIDKVVQAWKAGRLLDVPPTTLEFAPILDCNASCPGCPFGRARGHAGLKRVDHGHFARIDDRTVASLATARRVLEASAEAGVGGVLW